MAILDVICDIKDALIRNLESKCRKLIAKRTLEKSIPPCGSERNVCQRFGHFPAGLEDLLH